MSDCEKRILNALIDKYENSKSFVGANRVSQSFTVKISQLFGKYGDDSEFEIFSAVNESVALLERQGYLSVKRQKNGVVQSITLDTERLEDVYKYIRRTPKSDVVSELKRIIDVYKDENEILSRYCEQQTVNLAKNRAVEFFVDDLSEFDDMLKVISKITDVKNEMFERDFSIQVLGDSKAFERLRSRVISLLYKYGEFADKETVTEELNVIKNPGHVYFKGNGRITLCGQTIDLSVMDGDIAISSELLKSIDDVTVFGSAVITIENLTTFNAFRCDDSFAIYLGGYHNTVRRGFIKRLYDQNTDKKYLHFGDIDAGGFYILQHLRKKTGIAFEAYKMDVQTLIDNTGYTKKLTENDRKRLSSMLEGEFGETVNYMLANDCKLEQEAMDLIGLGL